MLIPVKLSFGDRCFQTYNYSTETFTKLYIHDRWTEAPCTCNFFKTSVVGGLNSIIHWILTSAPYYGWKNYGRYPFSRNSNNFKYTPRFFQKLRPQSAFSLWTPPPVGADTTATGTATTRSLSNRPKASTRRQSPPGTRPSKINCSGGEKITYRREVWQISHFSCFVSEGTRRSAALAMFRAGKAGQPLQDGPTAAKRRASARRISTSPGWSPCSRSRRERWRRRR